MTVFLQPFCLNGFLLEVFRSQELSSPDKLRSEFSLQSCFRFSYPIKNWYYQCGWAEYIPTLSLMHVILIHHVKFLLNSSYQCIPISPVCPDHKQALNRSRRAALFFPLFRLPYLTLLDKVLCTFDLLSEGEKVK